MDFKSALTFLGDRIGQSMAGTEASMPAAASRYTGASYFATDTFMDFVCDGTRWFPTGYAKEFAWNGKEMYESVPRSQDGGWTTTAALSTGVALATGVWIPKGVVLSKLAMWIGTAGVQGTTSGQHSFLALYDDADALLCYTADGTSTNRAANTEFEGAIAFASGGGAISTYTTLRSQIYQISLCWAVGTGGTPTVPVLRGYNTNLAALSGGKSGNGNATMGRMARTHGSGLTYPPPATIATPSNVAAGAWVAGVV